MSNLGNVLRVGALTAGLLLSTSSGALAQSTGTSGSSAATGGAGTGTAATAPGATAPGSSVGSAPGTATTGRVDPGGTPIAPGPSGADIETQTVGPAGVPIAPGPAGTVGRGGLDTLGGPSTSSGCPPGTSAPNRATARLAPAPVIISPEPGQPPEVTPQSPSNSESSAGSDGLNSRC